MRLDDGAVLIERFNHLLDRRVPFKHSGLLRILGPKPLDFLVMPLPVELFVVVEMPAFGARDILGEQRPHKINNICLWVTLCIKKVSVEERSEDYGGRSADLTVERTQLDHLTPRGFFFF